MDNYGFFRVAAASPSLKVGDVRYNLSQMLKVANVAETAGVSLLAFPELSLCGYTCADLFAQDTLLKACEDALAAFISKTIDYQCTFALGLPVECRGGLYNCAAVVRSGKLLGLVPKSFIPNYSEFYEARWFRSGASLRLTDFSYAGQTCPFGVNLIFSIGDTSFAVEICEDLWTPIPPSSHHCLSGAHIIVNLSASNEIVGKQSYRKSLVANQSARTISTYVYASCGFGESTTDLVFASSSLIYENGALLNEGDRFIREGQVIIADTDIEKLRFQRRQKVSSFASNASLAYQRIDAGPVRDTDFSSSLSMHRHIDPHPFVPEGQILSERCKEILSIQVQGLATRLDHIGARKVVIGISGGLDSTLALLVAVLAFDFLELDRKGIIGVTMPGLGTTKRTKNNALALMDALGVESREISIVKAVEQHFADIGQDPDIHDVTYENSQARERTQILMDLSNKEGALVVGTGDLSELALGWATYNGDHMSMYAVNASVPKTLVRSLVRWAATERFAGTGTEPILLDILDTPVSPELIPADSEGNISQITEDLVGPYELHDFFLYNFFRGGCSPRKLYFLACKAFAGVYEPEVIQKWLETFVRRFFNQQFKRSCLPDGPKVGSVSLSPRGDWRMPSDASSTVFLWDL